MFGVVCVVYIFSLIYLRFIANRGFWVVRNFRNTTISGSLLLMYCIVR